MCIRKQMVYHSVVLRWEQFRPIWIIWESVISILVMLPSSYTLHRLFKFFVDAFHTHMRSIMHICQISIGYLWAIWENWTNSIWPPFGEGQNLNWHNFRQNRCSFMILVFTIGFLGMPDLVVWSAITLDIALWVKSKMAAICPRSSNKFISFST